MDSAATKEAAPPQAGQRDKKLKHLLELHCLLSGVPHAALIVDRKLSGGAKLAQDGITLIINPLVAEELASSSPSNSTPPLPLETADRMVIDHELGHVRDFLDPSFFIERTASHGCPDYARRFFNARIDDIVIDARLGRVPLYQEHFANYIERTTSLKMAELPLHAQLLYYLRALLFSLGNKAVDVHDEVVQILGYPDEPSEFSLALQEALCIQHLSYKERHRMADELLSNSFLRLLLKDLENSVAHKLLKSYEESPLYHETETKEQEYHALKINEDAKKRSESLYKLFARTDDEEVLPPKDRTSSFLLPGVMGSDTLEPLERELEGYSSKVKNLTVLIEEVAEVLTRLSTKTQTMMVPRYKARRAYEGARLSPQALPSIALQLQTGRASAIWQPVQMKPRYQEDQFSGLDVYLLLDVSSSMAGDSAKAATDMAISLIEGLSLARYRASTDIKRGSIKVRVQLIAFGAGSLCLTPLAPQLTHKQKAQACYRLAHPQSDHTAIGPALRQVRTSVLGTPHTQALCLIVSDGLFSDNINALRVMKSMPPHCYVGQIKIGESTAVPITPHYEKIIDPQVLPAILLRILKELLDSQDEFPAKFYR